MFVFQPSVTDSRLYVCVSAECDWQPTLCLCFSRVWLTDNSMFVFQPSVTNRRLYVCVSAECCSMFVFQPIVTDRQLYVRVSAECYSMFVFQPSVTLCLCCSRVLLWRRTFSVDCCCSVHCFCL